MIAASLTSLKNISKLKQKGLVQRIGPDKCGHWEADFTPEQREKL
jgi:predicted HTH transcriptional regulator